MSNLGILALSVISTYSTEANSDLGQPSFVCQARYKPNSHEAKSLFSSAAKKAGVPHRWAYTSALHQILAKESSGWVGVPNYTINDSTGKPARYNPNSWEEIHQRLRRNAIVTNQYLSSASGLGQLVLANVNQYYPSGRLGIGNCQEEAVGMLRYIKDRYGSPEKAWKYWQKHRHY